MRARGGRECLAAPPGNAGPVGGEETQERPRTPPPRLPSHLGARRRRPPRLPGHLGTRCRLLGHLGAQRRARGGGGEASDPPPSTETPGHLGARRRRPPRLPGHLGARRRRVTGASSPRQSAPPKTHKHPFISDHVEGEAAGGPTDRITPSPQTKKGGAARQRPREPGESPPLQGVKGCSPRRPAPARSEAPGCLLLHDCSDS